MCGRVTIVEFDDLFDIARAVEYRSPLYLKPDWPAGTNDAFPNSSVPLLVARSSIDGVQVGESLDWNQEVAKDGSSEVKHLAPSRMLWGFEPRGRDSLVFNTRIETADELPLWKESLEKRRCIVPVKAFYEPHETEQAINPRTGRTVKQLYRFTIPGKYLLLAGLWKADRFSVITTQPNESVAGIHKRMPLLLTQDDAHEWLLGDWRSVPKTCSIELESQPVYAAASTVQQDSLF